MLFAVRTWNPTKKIPHQNSVWIIPPCLSNNVGTDRAIILKCYRINRAGVCRIAEGGADAATGSSEYVNTASRSIKDERKFLDYMSYCQLLKKHSSPWSQHSYTM